MIVSLANMVEARDGVTGLHIMYTSTYVEIMARALQKKPKYQEIPLSARIMAIADVYDALRAERSYKDACSKEEAKRITLTYYI